MALPGRRRGTTARAGWWFLGLSTVATVYLYAWLSLLAWAALPVSVLGLEAVVVTSGSMAPHIRAGDVVLLGSAQTPPAVGTVITFRDRTRAGTLVTHRVASRHGDGSVTTRGDANRQPDPSPVAPGDVVGQGRLLVPHLGLPLVWLRGGELAALVAWAAAMLAAVVIRPPVRHLRGRGRRRVTPLLRAHLALRSVGARPLRRLATPVALLALLGLAGGGTTVAALAAQDMSGGNAFAARTWPVVYHLHNHAVSAAAAPEPPPPATFDTDALPLMLAHPAAPGATALRVYSDDVRPGRSGRWLLPAAGAPPTPATTATWVTAAAPARLVLDGEVAVTLWVQRRGSGPGAAPRALAFAVAAVDPGTGATTWEQSVVRSQPIPQNHMWVRVDVDIDVSGLVIDAGQRVRLRIQAPHEELAIAYATTAYPARLTLPAS
jgi:signal peptidase I